MRHYSIILATTPAPEWGIGKDNALPWKHHREDMAHFASVTTKTISPSKINAVIMGRKTWDSIPESKRPLRQRLNIVISSNPSLATGENTNPLFLIAPSFQDALLMASNHPGVESIFVIGGASVYTQALSSSWCNKLYLTTIHYDSLHHGACDTFCPLDSFLHTFPDKFVEETGRAGDSIDYEITLYSRPELTIPDQAALIYASMKPYDPRSDLWAQYGHSLLRLCREYLQHPDDNPSNALAFMLYQLDIAAWAMNPRLAKKTANAHIKAILTSARMLQVPLTEIHGRIAVFWYGVINRAASSMPMRYFSPRLPGRYFRYLESGSKRPPGKRPQDMFEFNFQAAFPNQYIREVCSEHCPFSIEKGALVIGNYYRIDADKEKFIDIGDEFMRKFRWRKLLASVMEKHIFRFVALCLSQLPELQELQE